MVKPTRLHHWVGFAITIQRKSALRKVSGARLKSAPQLKTKQNKVKNKMARRISSRPDREAASAAKPMSRAAFLKGAGATALAGVAAMAGIEKLSTVNSVSASSLNPDLTYIKGRDGSHAQPGDFEMHVFPVGNSAASFLHPLSGAADAIYPGGTLPDVDVTQDVRNLQWAVSNIAAGGTVTMKQGEFHFGDESVGSNRGSVILTQGVNLRGETTEDSGVVSEWKTKVYGGGMVVPNAGGGIDVAPFVARDYLYPNSPNTDPRVHPINFHGLHLYGFHENGIIINGAKGTEISGCKIVNVGNSYFATGLMFWGAHYYSYSNIDYIVVKDNVIHLHNYDEATDTVDLDNPPSNPATGYTLPIYLFGYLYHADIIGNTMTSYGALYIDTTYGALPGVATTFRDNHVTMNKLLNPWWGIRDTLALATLDGQVSITNNYFKHYSTANNYRDCLYLRQRSSGTVLFKDNELDVDCNRLAKLQGNDHVFESNKLVGYCDYAGIYLDRSSYSNISRNDLSELSAKYTQVDVDVNSSNNILTENIFGSINPPDGWATVICRGDYISILRNDYRQTGVLGLKYSDQMNVWLSVDSSENLVFESGNFPEGTGGAKYQVRDDNQASTSSNRVVGHNQETYQSQEYDNSGIGQRLQALNDEITAIEAELRAQELEADKQRCAETGGIWNSEIEECEY